jgi:hypothetical protein
MVDKNKVVSLTKNDQPQAPKSKKQLVSAAFKPESGIPSFTDTPCLGYQVGGGAFAIVRDDGTTEGWNLTDVLTFKLTPAQE